MTDQTLVIKPEHTVLVKRARLMYANTQEPVVFRGGKPRYGAKVYIATEHRDKLEAVLLQLGVEAFGAKTAAQAAKDQKKNNTWPIKYDEGDGTTAGFDGISANRAETQLKPDFRNPDRSPIREEVRDGAIANVYIQFYASAKNDHSIFCTLIGGQITGEREHWSAAVKLSDDDFEDLSQIEV